MNPCIPNPPHVEKFDSLASVMALMPQLAEAAKAWGQADALVDLPYFFSEPHRLRHLRWLLLVSDAPGGVLLGAVMLEEYGSRWFGTGIFSTFNRRWRRTVFGPLTERVGVAAAAARFLLGRGARFVNIDIDMGEVVSDEPNPVLSASLALAAERLRGTGAHWALHAGRKHFDLPLGADFDQSVQTLGPNTRRNLRRYRRDCEEKLGATYGSGVELPLAEFLELNTASHYRVSDRMARWRYGTVGEYTGVFLIGMRDRVGQWLAVGGCRRSDGAVEMDWQMNRKGSERYSLSTALRAFLIADEAARGTQTLSVEGGMQGAMQDGFRYRAVYNLAVRRESWWLRAVEGAAVKWFPTSTFAKIMRKPWRQWQQAEH